MPGMPLRWRECPVSRLFGRVERELEALTEACLIILYNIYE
jgi:hypothetical protein